MSNVTKLLRTSVRLARVNGFRASTKVYSIPQQCDPSRHPVPQQLEKQCPSPELSQPSSSQPRSPYWQSCSSPPTNHAQSPPQHHLSQSSTNQTSRTPSTGRQHSLSEPRRQRSRLRPPRLTTTLRRPQLVLRPQQAVAAPLVTPTATPRGSDWHSARQVATGQPTRAMVTTEGCSSACRHGAP